MTTFSEVLSIVLRTWLTTIDDPLAFLFVLLIKSSILDEAIGSSPAVGSSKSNNPFVFQFRNGNLDGPMQPKDI